MSRVVAVEFLTLDGVMQSPGHPDEDRRDGFEHGGWAPPYRDDVMAANMTGGTPGEGRFLFGRRTFDHFASVWPNQPEDNPFTRVLNEGRKYVASTTLSEPLEWANSSLLEGDVPSAVARLRAEPGGDLVVLGSGELVRSLLAHGQLDELKLNIHPLVLGTGRRLFADSELAKLRLVDCKPTTTGVLLTTYVPA